MVWGMTLPEGFGEFWPSGAFEGYEANGGNDWYGRLNVDYFQQSPEVQKALGAGQIMLGDYAYYVNGKFRCEAGTCEGNKPPLPPIREHEPPRTFDTEKGYKTLGSLIMLNDSILAVDEQLKSIIERLEPSVHLFYPIEIRMPRGKAYTESYYTLVIGQYFDAFSLEETGAGSVHERPSGVIRPDTSKAGLNGLAVRKADFGDAHLWRDRRFKVELTCFSDELKAEIDKAGLKIPKHYKMKEV